MLLFWLFFAVALSEGWMCDNKLSKSWHSHVIVWIVIVNIVQY